MSPPTRPATRTAISANGLRKAYAGKADLDRGRIVAQGTPRELKRRVPGAHLRLRFADATSLDAAARALREGTRDDEALVLRVPDRGGVRSLRDVLVRLGHGVAVEDLSIHTADLDDEFLALTGDPAKEQAPVGAKSEPAGPALASERRAPVSTRSRPAGPRAKVTSPMSERSGPRGGEARPAHGRRQADTRGHADHRRTGGHHDARARVQAHPPVPVDARWLDPHVVGNVLRTLVAGERDRRWGYGTRSPT